MGKQDRDVAAEFPDYLAAGAAGWSQTIHVGDYGDGVEAALALGDGFEDGHALSATGEAEGGVFDIASSEDAAGFGAYGRAYTKIRDGGASVLEGLGCGGD